MKKILIFLAIFFVLPGLAVSDTIILSEPVPTSPVYYDRLHNWQIDKIDPEVDLLVVKYQKADSTGALIKSENGSTWHTWTCRNIPITGENSECTALGTPFDCCTGPETGGCDGYESTCFNDVFGFQIRTQDVGSSLGLGLRTLIWNRMAPDVLPPGITGSFQ